MITKIGLTTKLNIKVVCMVLVLMFTVIAHSQWISLQERKKESAGELESITAYLVKNMTAGSFVEITHRQEATGKTTQEQVEAINKEIQPMLANILIPGNAAKYGIYSRRHERIVAVGPNLDGSLLATAQPGMFATLDNTPRLGEKEDSIVWYGARILYHRRPISDQGQIVGYAFACVNLDAINAQAWKKTIRTFLGGFIALLFVIVLFQEVFIKLKKDLELFAEEIVKGRAKHFESELPELTPVLKYISEQTEIMAGLDRLNIIGEMAASIGHEVRNPMTTVRGFLQHMSNKGDFNTHKEHFELMIGELDRANSIITEFLSLAKNKAMNFQDISLNKVIEDILPLIQVDALRCNCQVEINLGVIPTILIDESSIRQLILNMVRNAIEAMPQGGTITICTIKCGQKVWLAIQDEGIGISADILDKLGIPFVTTKESGTGLGLAVCYRIVQRHEAIINVESQPGAGTRFTIVFNAD